MFNQWDDTTRTGNDTETAIVVVVLCVGAALIGAQIMVRPSTDSSSRVDADCVRPCSFFVGVFGRPSPIPAVSPPAIPRVYHNVGLFGSWDEDEWGRVTVEWFYTGRQRVEDNPYRGQSEPYRVFGVLIERRLKRWARD
jgi:hypothetical protein